MIKKKKKKDYNGSIPCNARISIDYTKEKPKVKFSYPERNPVKQNLFGIHFLFIFYAGLIIFVIFIAYPFYHTDYPVNCNATFYNTSFYYLNASGLISDPLETFSKITDLNISCDNKDYSYSFSNEKSFKSLISSPYWEFKQYSNWKERLKKSSLIVISLLSVMIVLYFINKYVTRILVKWKWYKDRIPDINKALSGMGYYKQFKSSDVEIKNNIPIIELPVFDNIYLDYRATKDFSRYLARVEVLEHPFCKGLMKIIRKPKKKRKFFKKSKNISIWKCTFYFSQKPVLGKLEIFFK